MDSSEEEDEYIRFNGGEFDESSQGWSDQEADYESPPWPGDDYSSSEYEDEQHGEGFDPKPPAYSQSTQSNKSWSGEEEIDHEGESWCEENEYPFNLEDGDHESEPEYGEPTNHQIYEEDDETDSQFSLDEAESEAEVESIGESGENEFNSITNQKEAWCEEGELNSCQEEPYHIYYSGHNQGPEAYLRWERDMEEWFQENQIPHEERTAIAEETLVDEAYYQWETEAYFRLDFDPRDPTWEEMKLFLHEEFVEEQEAEPYYPRPLVPSEPRRRILAPTSKPKVKSRKALSLGSKDVSPNTLMGKTEAKTPVKAKEVQPVHDHPTVKERQRSKPLPKPKERPKQCKSSKLSKEVGTTCYRCHHRGHYAVVCPTRPIGNSHALELKPDSSRDCLFQKNPEISISSIMHLSLPKRFDPGIRLEERNTNREMIMFQFSNATTVRLSITPSIPKVLNSDMMHLFLVQNVEIFAGIKEINCKEVPPDENRGVILHFLLKGDPPDVSSNIKYQLHQDKVLNSKLRMKTNLLSLGADYTVSRSKPFQEGEYDEDIKSSSAKEHGTRIPEGESMKLRRAKETRELCLVQREATIQQTFSTNTWRVYATQPEFTTKKNQPKRISYEEVIGDTIWQLFNGPDGDMRSLIKSFRPNQEEPGIKSNCFGFKTHQRHTANWIRSNPSLDEGDINFSNRTNRNFPDLDPRVLMGGLRPNQKELSYKPTCYGILTQPGRLQNWIHSNPGFGLRDIQLPNPEMLNLPYLEAHGFNQLQTRLWRPGERSNRPEEISRHLGESSIILPCSRGHRIRRILTFVYFPFPDAFTLEGISLQRLFLLCCCVLETCSMHLDVPRHHSFTPKLSRLKPHHKFPYLAKNSSLQQLEYQDHISLTICFLFQCFRTLD